eukprot:CAMPEP_0202866880 /NCGR_PEP_ID=MMETSP1391-20130828/8409_1 /ASSEMBLY_ACC=CAM_ASM_000867 /TAXON_ID=1034604 /ORGANISM="Chlamydomonas leiostraca, Strain SAG 11-49" /LENGTH=388 /DNA_ID=CAMNT_0049546867 /DNA_START=81 /DNA_END=1247 /DNA_ORIENTATION=-
MGQAQAWLALAFIGVSMAITANEIKGWGGMPADIDSGRAISLHNTPGQKFDPTTTPWVEQVASNPKAYVYHNFLTPEERAHMVRIAAPLLKRSRVSGANGTGVIDEIRTSYGMFINRLQDPIIERIEKRISLVTHVPVSHQEAIQVLRYTKGQTYRAHYDSGAEKGGHGPQFRLATFLMYLSDVEEGGETAFPMGSKWADPDMPARLKEQGVKFSDCAEGHVAYNPKAGDAVLFYSFHTNVTMDSAAMHTGCPVVKGIKWAAPVWIHIDEYDPPDWEKSLSKYRTTYNEVNQDIIYPDEPGLCVDLHDKCVEWAASGECTNNPSYMTGGDAQIGHCRRACKTCRVCQEGDLQCINENRHNEGYLEIDRTEMEWLGVKWWLGEHKEREL